MAVDRTTRSKSRIDGDEAGMLNAMTEPFAVAARASFSITSVGYLVPRRRFDGVVHSVYARACNISCEDTLLTMLSPGGSEGPTALILGHDSPSDLRSCFGVGEAVSARGTQLRSSAIVADLGRAMVWEAAAPVAVVEAGQVAANLRVARTSIAAQPRRLRSVLHREARATCASLEQACRACDVRQALHDATRLIGWGEGLTPSGDDFLVGLMSGLDALTGESGSRRDFLGDLGAAIVERAAQTTPIAAHYLRLAAHGHFNANVHGLRAALLSADGAPAVRRVMDDTFTLGATSGVDLALGVLSGIAAWCHPDSPREP